MFSHYVTDERLRFSVQSPDCSPHSRWHSPSSLWPPKTRVLTILQLELFIFWFFSAPITPVLISSLHHSILWYPAWLYICLTPSEQILLTTFVWPRFRYCQAHSKCSVNILRRWPQDLQLGHQRFYRKQKQFRLLTELGKAGSRKAQRAEERHGAQVEGGIQELVRAMNLGHLPRPHWSRFPPPLSSTGSPKYDFSNLVLDPERRTIYKKKS